LDETNGNVANDSSGNANFGSVTNPYWVEGRYGNGLGSNASNQTYIDLANPTILNYTPTEFSLELWFKSDQNINGSLPLPYYLFVSKTSVNGLGQALLWIGMDGKVSGYISQTGATGSSYIYGTKNQWNANQWYHIALTYKGTSNRAKIWIDNVIDGSNFSAIPSIETNAGFFRIGARDDLIQGFNGTIDEVRISNIERDFAIIDSDADGVLDENDNCPYTFNKNQRDYDSDGVGDWCDNCQLTPNADQLDSNNDELGDACENCGYKIITYCSVREETFSPLATCLNSY
ncbi:MAG: LamG-like jellyroll fold domain-containing protein, partial [archaeon]|nr:LamG-like jellyroll fold domain-containing protein [archaeon]